MLEAWEARDAGALEILMERHASRVFRVAFGITRNEADAEEVVRDVFLSLFEKIGAFEQRAALGTWLYRVTTNAAAAPPAGQAPRAGGEPRRPAPALPGRAPGGGALLPARRLVGQR